MKQKTATGSSGAVDIYGPRLQRLRSAMAEWDHECLLVTNPRDIGYLTPFSGEDSWLLVTHERAHVLSDFRFQEELAALPRGFEVVIRKGEMRDALAALVAQLKISYVSFQSEHMTVHNRRLLLRDIKSGRLRESDGLLADLRVIKDETEIGLLRQAVAVQEKALQATLAELEPGQREIEVAARLEFEMRRLGSSQPAFEVIVAAGGNASKPHAVPGPAKIRRNEPLLIDWGATVGGYRSDMTRTICLGSFSKKMRQVYEVVLEAQQAACAAVYPGRSCRDLDGIARKIIEQAGYGEQFGHSLGHGIGLDVHEAPRVSKRAETFLRPGMVITIEPGIYLPGIGGVRIEDDLLVTERGGKNLCTLPKDVDWAMQ